LLVFAHLFQKSALALTTMGMYSCSVLIFILALLPHSYSFPLPLHSSLPQSHSVMEEKSDQIYVTAPLTTPRIPEAHISNRRHSVLTSGIRP
jgi:hypothetical protein